MIGASIHVYEAKGKMCLADPADRKRWSKMGVRPLMGESSLSQQTVYKILAGDAVRRYILSSFMQAVDKIKILVLAGTAVGLFAFPRFCQALGL